MDTESLDFWRQVANRRWGKYIRSHEDRALTEALRRVRVGTAVEIGAEQGFYAPSLVEAGWHVVATEICQRKVDLFNACNDGARCVLVSASSHELPFKRSSVDLVISMEVPINHEVWFCQEVQRILTLQGAVAFTTFNRNSYRGLLANLKSRIRGDEIYYQTTYQGVRKRFAAAGFAPCYEAGFCWAPFTRTSDSPVVPWAASIESFMGLRALPSISPWVVSVFTRS